MQIIYFIIAIIFALTTHEAAHAWAANRLGDPTAKNAGRLSLNPLKHLDFLGTMLFIVAEIGWGKPVPVNEAHFAHPQRDNALVALAGPLTNLVTAIIIAIPLKYLTLPQAASNLFSVIFQTCLVLFAFNCLPIPPLDGSKIIGFIVPAKIYKRYRYFLEANLVYVLIIFLIDLNLFPKLFGFSIINTFIQFIVSTFTTLIFIGT